MLNERTTIYNQLKDDKKLLYAYKYKTEKDYKEILPFMKEVDSKSLQSSTRNLLTAFQNIFDSCSGKRKDKVGYPQFKLRKNKQSYTTYNINYNTKIDFEKKGIKLPKIKTLGIMIAGTQMTQGQNSRNFKNYFEINNKIIILNYFVERILEFYVC